MVFGAVATGSPNPNDAATAALSKKPKGSAPTALASTANTGIIIDAVAILEANSLSKVTILNTTSRINTIGSVSRLSIWAPIHLARPLWSKPLARANPPPKNRSTPH